MLSALAGVLSSKAREDQFHSLARIQSHSEPGGMHSLCARRSLPPLPMGSWATSGQ